MAPKAGSRIDHIRSSRRNIKVSGGRSSEPSATQVGHTHCVRQDMLPQDISIGNVCIFMCLAASLTILILSIFSIYVIMCKSTTLELGAEREQASRTEPEPFCLRQQF